MKNISATVGLAFLVACGGSSSGGGGGGDGGVYMPPFGQCAGGSAQPPGSNSVCLDGVGDPPSSPPEAVIEHELTTYQGIPAVYIRITLNPAFADNTYGANAVGWPKSHKFNDLVGSDHINIVALDANGDTVFDLDLDYLSQDANAPCGYSSLGVTGGDGKVNLGDPAAILAVTTSMDRNLNERGYCDFTTDSPMTDENCTPDPAAPDWDFRVVYEIWIAQSAFDPIGFGSAFMSQVHASPAKGGTNTVEVTPGDCCIPDVDTQSCDPTPPGDCTTNNDCGDHEFCHDGTCLVIVT